MKTGSLFSGTGALDLAAEDVFGATPAWFCEYDDAPSRILAHHWPETPNHGDVTAINWQTVEPIDILTAGYPCQPFSLAGSRKGSSDVRHLWPFVAEAISHLRPRYVLLENVRGHLSMGFGDVLGDLSRLGYDAQWSVVRASAAGAPHRRERIFILAEDTHSESGQQRGITAPGQEESRRTRANTGGRSGAPAPDPNGSRSGRRAPQPGTGTSNHQAQGSDPRAAAHASSIRGDKSDQPAERSTKSQNRAGLANERSAHHRTSWGIYSAAIERWERITGRPAPRPVVPTGRGGRDRLNPELAEWMMGLDKGHITEVPGLDWKAQLKAAGNGVVRHQAVMAYRHLLAISALPGS